MKYQIEIINPADRPDWDVSITKLAGYTCFHSAGWASVLSKTYSYKAVYFAIMENDNVAAVLPMMEIESVIGGSKGICLPFSDYCESISTNGAGTEPLIEAAFEYGRKRGWRYIERRGGDYDNLPAAKTYYEHSLNLKPGIELLFSNLKSSVQRNIRRASREGVTVNIGRSNEMMREYYRLHCITRKRHGLPPQPFSFFNNIFEYLVSKNKGCVVTASFEDMNIAGAIFLGLGCRALYKFGASDYKYQHLRPSDLVMWEGIKWFAENGYENLSLGRTEPENEGLRRFKTGWGTREREVKYYKYDLRHNTFVTENKAGKEVYKTVLKVMPVCFLRLIGSTLYRHMA